MFRAGPCAISNKPHRSPPNRGRNSQPFNLLPPLELSCLSLQFLFFVFNSLQPLFTKYRGWGYPTARFFYSPDLQSCRRYFICPLFSITLQIPFPASPVFPHPYKTLGVSRVQRSRVSDVQRYNPRPNFTHRSFSNESLFSCTGLVPSHRCNTSRRGAKPRTRCQARPGTPFPGLHLQGAARRSGAFASRG